MRFQQSCGIMDHIDVKLNNVLTRNFTHFKFNLIHIIREAKTGCVFAGQKGLVSNKKERLNCCAIFTKSP